MNYKSIYERVNMTFVHMYEQIRVINESVGTRIQ